MSSGGGIVITQAIGAALEVNTIINELEAPALEAPQASGPWRPPQWTPGPALTSVTDARGNLYVFDAVIQSEHQRAARKAEHPVQTGANLSDHIFILPARVVLEIGMSDAMDSFESGMWTAASSKSVSAYQQLKTLWENRQPLTVTTRLDTYQNMFIMNISSLDNAKTRYGLKALIAFEEMFTGSVSSSPVADSARPQTTDSSSEGSKATISVDNAVQSQHEYMAPSPAILNGIGIGSAVINTGHVPSAGNWNSNNISQGIPK
jgi:hypothetical protein